ncbi:MAG: DUF4388 domain-containing protein [Coriobacteriia bacterium]
MALRGNLRDFSLPDVFQLVTFSKKTGVLRIKRADGTDGSVWFRDGDVFFAQSNWHGEPLGERLVAASRITPSALAKALTIKQGEGDGGRRLGEILIEEGYITDKVLEAFVQEQIQDTIFDLMRWDEGEFDFELLPDVVDEDIGLAVSIENVIMEGSRRLEEWTRIKKKIPSMDIVFKMATAPGEGTFEISLKPIEWNLLLLVDGTRSVSQLASDTNRTDFEVARIMYGLFSAGLLEVAADDEVERLRAERAERELHMADIRAQRAEVDAEQTREAIAREDALQAQAQARSSVKEEEPTAESTLPLVADEASEPRVEPEMPEFLAGEAAAASPQDMAVFEEMMGVLDVPAEESAPQPSDQASEPPVEESSEPRAEPELPPELEMGSGSDFGPALDMEDEALLGVLNIGAGPDLQSQDVESNVPELVVEPDSVEQTPEVAGLTGDLERDLMALGLGELPSPETPPIAGETGDVAAIGATLDVGFEWQEFQTTPEEPAAPAADTDGELTIAEIEAAALAAQGEPTHEDFGPMDAGLTDYSAGMESQIAEEGGSDLSTPDLTDILESLDEAGTEIVQTESLDDEELGVTPSMGVISTDSFLADIAPEELGVGMSAGLGDELSALTGAGGNRRPTANVKRLPEPGSAVDIHLDQAVDKELVRKVIEGIKNL